MDDYFQHTLKTFSTLKISLHAFSQLPVSRVRYFELNYRGDKTKIMQIGMGNQDEIIE